MSKVSFIQLLFIFAMTIVALPISAFAQQPTIALPLIEASDKPEIDGLWTTSDEWSKASLASLNYTDGTQLVIRAMRDGESVYVLLEMPQDFVVDGHAAVCFDTLSDGGAYMNPDDYCFVLGENLREFHGDGRTTLMQQIPLEPDVVADRGLSGTNSPYRSASDHVTYEFQVPMDHIGADRTQYGFYVTFDTLGQTTNYSYYYSWPDSKSASYLRVASPRAWGIASTSSDVEIPEFPLHVVGAIAALVGIMAIIGRIKILKP